MKILHTSDWHLGHTLYNYDRTEEQMAMLEQMAEIVENHKPDLFLLCGDVYHNSQPSASVQTMLTDGLVRIHNAYPEMTIVMTAGNHDSGTKHEIFKTPWRALGVYAIGQLEKEKPDEQIIEIPGKGYVVAVPYANERTIPDGFFQQLLDRVNEKNTEGLPYFIPGVSMWQNYYTAAQQGIMEHYGAVFLPNAGDRIGTNPVNVGSFGLYWAGGKQSTTVYDVLESSAGYFMVYSSNPNLGSSVRLVRDVQ